MEIVIAKDQRMQFQPRAKHIFKNYMKRHDFLVKCRPQDVVTMEQDPVTRSQMTQLEALKGTIRVFMGPSSFYTDQNECFCGLWVRDLGSFLKKIFIILEVDTAKLIATVKHHGVPIGNAWNRRNEFRLDLYRGDSSNPRTAVKCRKYYSIGPAQGEHSFQQFFHEVNSDSFTITMKLKLDT